jgi:HSP20 family protein
MHVFKRHQKGAPADAGATEAAPAPTAPSEPAVSAAETTPVEPAAPAAETTPVEPGPPVGLLDQLLEDWLGLWRVPRLVPPEKWIPLERITVEQNDGTLVIRAALPDVDPEKDVSLTVAHGVLQIHAEHRDDRTSEDGGIKRHTVSYEAFSRSLPLPAGVTADEIHASYADGVLEVTVPAPVADATRKIPVDTA